MAPSWMRRRAFVVGGHAAATLERLTAEERDYRILIAEGVMKRAERFGLWRSRSWASSWRDALKAERGSEWWAENRDEFYAVLEADEWFEPMLTGEGLMAGLRTTFAGEEKKTSGLVKK